VTNRARASAGQAARPAPGQVSWVRRLSAECFGTFALVFVAAGADTLATVTSGQVSSAARAVAPALLIAALIYAIGDVSGAHFNPAVTLAFAVRGLFPARLVGPYWAAQLVGAVAGAVLLRGMFGAASLAGISTPHIASATAVALEAMFTLLLVTVVLGTADRARIVGPDAALAVGATIALCGLIGLPVEGASMNPARSLGPAIVGGDLSNAWIYVVGPIAGGLLAVALARLLHGPPVIEGEAAEAAQGG
jgi:aquaporin Z